MRRYPVFNSSWAGDSRFFRLLQEIHGTFCSVLGRIGIEDKRVIGRRAVRWGLRRRVTQSLVPSIQMVQGQDRAGQIFRIKEVEGAEAGRKLSIGKSATFSLKKMADIAFWFICIWARATIACYFSDRVSLMIQPARKIEQATLLEYEPHITLERTRSVPARTASALRDRR